MTNRVDDQAERVRLLHGFTSLSMPLLPTVRVDPARRKVILTADARRLPLDELRRWIESPTDEGTWDFHLIGVTPVQAGQIAEAVKEHIART